MHKIEKKIVQYLKERKWDTLRPSDIAKSISIEAAELLEIFQWDNPELEEVQKDTAKKQRISEELADVLIYALEMAVLLHISSEKIIAQKLAKVKKKYPAHLMRKISRAGSGAGTEKIYWKIKENYRRAGK